MRGALGEPDVEHGGVPVGVNRRRCGPGRRKGLGRPGPDDRLDPAVAAAEIPQQLTEVPIGAGGTGVVRSRPRCSTSTGRSARRSRRSSGRSSRGARESAGGHRCVVDPTSCLRFVRAPVGAGGHAEVGARALPLRVACAAGAPRRHSTHGHYRGRRRWPSELIAGPPASAGPHRTAEPTLRIIGTAAPTDRGEGSAATSRDVPQEDRSAGGGLAARPGIAVHDGHEQLVMLADARRGDGIVARPLRRCAASGARGRRDDARAGVSPGGGDEHADGVGQWRQCQACELGRLACSS